MKISVVLRHAFKDRPLVLLWLFFVIISLLTTILFAFRVHPSDLTLPVRYTAFGVTQVYNDAWYYLLVFLGFGLLILVLHSLIAMKLFSQKGPGLARFFILLSIVIVIIGYFLISSVLGIASLPQ